MRGALDERDQPRGTRCTRSGAGSPLSTYSRYTLHVGIGEQSDRRSARDHGPPWRCMSENSMYLCVCAHARSAFTAHAMLSLVQLLRDGCCAVLCPAQ
jgi:hypothetical protein